jgi:hypothetical protein
VLITSFSIEYAFIRQFGLSLGAAYSAFLQNLLMSVLFIHMYVRRGGSEGQSVSIAVSKWIGTLAPTIHYGVLDGGNLLVLVAGAFCTLFDLVYIGLLVRA